MKPEDKLKVLFKDIFQVKESDFRDELSPDTVKEWDSVSHLVLYTSLEQEFGITILSEEMVAMTSVGKIKSLLKAKGIQ